MINILFYGNCQLHAIKETLSLSKTEYKIHSISCWMTDINKENFTDIIKQANIIITQPIQDNYRKLDYLSTNYIINNSDINSKIIIFDSCHFNFYYFDLTYKFFKNELLNKPIDYHYNKMIESYINNNSIEYYIDNYVNNENLKSSEELETIATNSLNELQKRYNENYDKYIINITNKNIYLISIYEFVKNNYKDKLLFYSMNHPTKYVIQYICEEIIKILQIQNTINYNIDNLSNPKSILYKCIQKNVNFDINNHLPLTLNKTNIYDIAKLYYDTYTEIEYNNS